MGSAFKRANECAPRSHEARGGLVPNFLRLDGLNHRTQGLVAQTARVNLFDFAGLGGLWESIGYPPAVAF